MSSVLPARSGVNGVPARLVTPSPEAPTPAAPGASARRFLVTCWPFVGHVFPQLSIAEALRERGHEVAFYTGEAARATVERAGFPVYGFRHVDEERAYAAVRAMESGEKPGRPGVRVVRDTFRTWLLEPIRDQIADLGPLIEEWQPDALVTDLSLWAPIVVLWESLPIPVALSSTFMGPSLPGRDAPPAFGFGLRPARGVPGRMLGRAASRVTDRLASGLRHGVDEIRAEHRLPPMGCPVNVFTGRLPLYLVPNVSELDYGRKDVGRNVHYVGPCLYHPAGEADRGGWLAGVPTDRPWVHVTESTLHYGQPFLLRAAVQGLADREMEVILTTGQQRQPGQLGLGAIARNLHLTQWVNHDQLLPRCEAMVTTGGTATLMSALRAGVPLVVVPTTWDKPDNARRVVEAGVGLRLAPGRCTPERLRDAVETLLGDPRYAENARNLAERLALAPGPVRSAELLEELVGVRTGGG